MQTKSTKTKRMKMRALRAKCGSKKWAIWLQTNNKRMAVPGSKQPFDSNCRSTGGSAFMSYSPGGVHSLALGHRPQASGIPAIIIGGNCMR